MLSRADYSLIDRILHRVALARPGLQLGLAEMENDLHRKALDQVPEGREVFVTGLPRAGTTLVLSLLHATGEFAAQTYRHMPFVLAPLLWESISGRFRRQAVDQERAHGDGMSVSYDSAEAFEEVIWLAHLKKRYVRDGRLLLLTDGDLDDEFITAFRALIRKTRLLAAGDMPSEAPRYLSKNNANVARLDLLPRLCPDSKIVVPFRHPLAHIASFMKQHRLFLERHPADPFALDYMQWLGHFEFGLALRPIDFGGWLEGETLPTGDDHGFWLRYWTAAYTHALNTAGDRVLFVDFDALLADGRTSLERIADHVGLENRDAFIAGAAELRAPTTRPDDASVCPAQDLEAAMAVHGLLRERI